MRVTINKVNERIAKYGYELVKGTGYFYFYPVDDSKPCLYDSMVMTCHLGDFDLDRWEEELIDRLEEEDKPNSECAFAGERIK